MKKTYIAPTLEIAIIHSERMIAESLLFGTTSIDKEEDVMVKGESSSPRYNVWDDDWSAQ